MVIIFTRSLHSIKFYPQNGLKNALLSKIAPYHRLLSLFPQRAQSEMSPSSANNSAAVCFIDATSSSPAFEVRLEVG
jgi:hypothetical protein